MRVAVIDLGSNSIRLLVAKIRTNSIEGLHRHLITTRLGRGVARKGFLDLRAMEDTLAGIEEFKQRALELKCDDIFAFGTSALREAANGEEFIQRVKGKTRIDIEVISGEEEAKLSYLGARCSLGLTGSALVMDIGGGSTEISSGEGERFFFKSVPLGAVRWTQKFLKEDLPDFSDVDRATLEARRLLSPLAKDISAILEERPFTAIGVGGTWTTLAAVSQKMEVYDAARIHGYVLEIGEVIHLCRRLLSMSWEERSKIPGIPPTRADIIGAGAIIASTAMEVLGLTSIQISEADLMEGFLIKKFLGKKLPNRY